MPEPIYSTAAKMPRCQGREALGLTLYSAGALLHFGALAFARSGFQRACPLAPSGTYAPNKPRPPKAQTTSISILKERNGLLVRTNFFWRARLSVPEGGKGTADLSPPH